MTSATALTARTGKATVGGSLVARITNWSVNPTMDSSSEWGDSDGEGYTNRTAGRRGATADVEGKYDTDDEVFDLFQEGDIVQLTLWMDDSGNLYYDFPRALCTDFSLSVNVDSEEVLGWTSSFGNDGPYHRPGEDGQASRTLPSG